MAKTIIREDIVKIGFDTNYDILTQIISQLDDIKKFSSAAGNDDGLEKLKKNANNASTATNQLKNSLNKVGSELVSVAKKTAGLTFKSVTLGVSACTTAVAGLVKQSVSAYSEFEQLKGGVETLFKDSAGVVQKYANDAYKTAGLSANAYMQAITSFSASMINSVGGDTAKAAQLSNMAVQDMSDNANKLGTSMGSVIETYQSLARGNYEMLDNLKLGYGGTKTELNRLLKDAEKLTGKSLSISNFSDVVEAIHAIQVQMDITGTTAKEANYTIQGSFNATKAAWQNLLPALIKGGDDFDQCVNNLIDSIVGMKNASGELEGGLLNNMMPALEKSLQGIGTLIERLAPTIEQKLPELIETLLPSLIRAGTSLFVGLVKAIPGIVKIVIDELPTVAKMLGDGIKEAFGNNKFITGAFEGLTNLFVWLKDNSEATKKAVLGASAAIAGIFIAVKGFNAFKSISSLFSATSETKNAKKGTSPLESLANVKVKTALKGIANLAIILGGLTILAGAFMLIAPYMSQLSDIKSVFKVVLVVGALGVLGVALTKLAGFVGAIPVSVVAKGLANIAIILTGFGALAAVFMWLSPLMAGLGDLKFVIEIASVMGVLGVLGTALTVFAGIVGLIPVPVVLLGLANMALVLGGMTAIIVAFGALTKIDGFTSFMTSGGEVLVQICDILGKMAGSLVGGAIDALSPALPGLGQNLGAFGQNIQPLFSAVSGVDMGGVAAFFGSLVGVLAMLTGSNIVDGINSFFGNKGTSLSQVGTQLSDFAKNSQSFFMIVSKLPESGFTSATQMFDCLAGLKGLPKEGGLVSWFTGDIPYAKISAGLKQLSNANIAGFFAFISKLNNEGFDKAKAFFDCLSSIGGLPKEGGVFGWFTGEADFTKLSEGLKHLSGEGVSSFFAMVGGLDVSVFAKTSQLFIALSKIGQLDLPKEGGFLGIGGESTLTLLGNELENFATNTVTFFAQINTLNLEKLYALPVAMTMLTSAFSNLRVASTHEMQNIVLQVDNMSAKVLQTLQNMLSKMSDLLKSTDLAPSAGVMMNTLVKGMISAKNSILSVVASIVSDIRIKLNSIISNANYALEQFGSDKRIALYGAQYARGTSGHPGGNAIVNDGAGAELVQMPNGRTFLPNGRNVFLPNAPKGMRVFTAEQTARILGRKNPTFHYENGTGEIDVLGMQSGESLASALVKKAGTFDKLKGFGAWLGSATINTVQSAISKWADTLLNEYGAKSAANYVASAGVEQWRSTVIKALKMEGQYSAQNVERTLFQMQTESGGNPQAINLWDINAKNGVPSKGLMQVIDPTFRAYARPGYHKNIYDPLSNILASIRYAVARYGSLTNAYRGVGYSNGIGNEVPLDDYTPGGNFTSSSSTVTENNSYSPVFNLTISGTNDDKATARKVKQWIREALDECFETMAKANAGSY